MIAFDPWLQVLLHILGCCVFGWLLQAALFWGVVPKGCRQAHWGRADKGCVRCVILSDLARRHACVVRLVAYCILLSWFWWLRCGCGSGGCVCLRVRLHVSLAWCCKRAGVDCMVFDGRALQALSVYHSESIVWVLEVYIMPACR